MIPTLFISQGIQFFLDKRNKNELRKIFSPIQIVPYFVAGFLIVAVNSTFPKGDAGHIEHLTKVTSAQLVGNFKYYLKLPKSFFGDPYTLDLGYSEKAFPERLVKISNGLSKLFYIVTFPFLLIGFLAVLKKDYLNTIFVILTVCLYLIWPYQQGLRFLYPILPFYIYYVFSGIFCVRGIPRPIFRSGLVGQTMVCSIFLPFLVFLGVQSLTIVSYNIRHDWKLEGPFDLLSKEMFQFINNETQENDVIIFFKPRVLNMITHRKALMVNDSKDFGKGDYVVIHREKGEYDQVFLDKSTVSSSKTPINPVFENSRFIVFEVVKGK